MAKSQNYSVDKVERKARLAGVHRQHKIEQRELRNLNRMGWQEQEDDDCTCDHRDPIYCPTHGP